ncbi:hypothetical protein GL263_14825, partial [Streptomyces durbertensis]|nr:hypothetical protein [Streptomyces durbertensis]
MHATAWTAATAAAMTLSWFGVRTVLTGTVYDRPRAMPLGDDSGFAGAAPQASSTSRPQAPDDPPDEADPTPGDTPTTTAGPTAPASPSPTGPT